MIILGFSEFIRNFKRNILIIIQMVVVYVIAIFTVSAFEEQYRLMDGVVRVFDDTGMIVLENNMLSDEFLREDVLEEILTNVDSIEHSICFLLFKDEEPVRITACNPQNITYRPELIKGQWCEDAPHEEGVINVVISANAKFEQRIGQKIELEGHIFKITGIVDTKEMVYGTVSSFAYTEANYLSFYEPLYDVDLAEAGVLIASYEDLLKYSLKDFNYALNWGNIVLIDFADDITDEEIEYNMKQLTERYGYTEGSEMVLTTEMYDYSWHLIMLKIMPMLMLLVVIVVVLIVSLAISGTINMLYERRNYGIYFICGNNWKNTFKFSLVNWTIMAVTSIILAVGACVFIYSKKLIKGIVLSFTEIHVMAILCITVVMILVAVFIPYIKLRRIQPVSILKENNK